MSYKKVKIIMKNLTTKKFKKEKLLQKTPSRSKYKRKKALKIQNKERIVFKKLEN